MHPGPNTPPLVDHPTIPTPWSPARENRSQGSQTTSTTNERIHNITITPTQAFQPQRAAQATLVH
eukprot:12924129-Prorocentrum_lima.AAC.1